MQWGNVTLVHFCVFIVLHKNCHADSTKPPVFASTYNLAPVKSFGRDIKVILGCYSIFHFSKLSVTSNPRDISLGTFLCDLL
jgi:hypothetical protein